MNNRTVPSANGNRQQDEHFSPMNAWRTVQYGIGDNQQSSKRQRTQLDDEQPTASDSHRDALNSHADTQSGKKIAT